MAHDRLLDIAIREFGEKGLEGASTRGIAGAAGTAMSSITYHYGGKEGLYLAVADHIAAHISREMLPILADDDLAPLTDPKAARAKIHRVLAVFAERMMGEQSAPLAMFIMREQLHPSAAFDHLYGAMGQVVDRLAALVSAVTGAPAGERTRIVAFLLTTPIFSLRSARGTLLRTTERETIDGALAQSLIELICLNTDAILDRLTAERQETA